MGSKKQLGQVKRAWERQIARPLEAVHLTQEWMKSAIDSDDWTAPIVRMSAALAVSGWACNHRTIYALDTDLLEELTRSGLPEGSVPAEILRRLPHECPMFVLDDPLLIHHEEFDCLYGHFIVLPAVLTDDVLMSHATLETCDFVRIVWFGHNVNDRYEFAVSTQAINMYRNSLDLKQQMKDVISGVIGIGKDEHSLPETILASRDKEWSTTVSTMWPVAVMAILYACSDEPDFLEIEPPTPIVQGRGKTKGDDLRVLQVGLRIGTALRSHRNTSSKSTGLGQSTVSPHVRRAHWHRFWTGPQNGERSLVLRWLPPIPVNIEKGEIPATIRPMRKIA